MLARYGQWPQQAFQNQLFLFAHLHGKRVMPLACERVITCHVRAFTLFPKSPWRVTFSEPEKSCRSSKVNCIGYETREKLIMFWNPRYGRTSIENKPTGVHPFNSPEGDSITSEYLMGGVCE